MLDNNFYKELSEKLRENSNLMQEYIVQEKELLNKKQVLLKNKEKELDEIRQYLVLTSSVVETLKQEINLTTEQLKILEADMVTGVQVSIGIEQDLEKLSTVKPVEMEPKKEVKYSSINSILSSLSDLKSESESLSNDETDKSDMESSIDVNNVVQSNSVNDDITYLNLVLENCKLPEDTSKLAIWKRRVLVKHYMESGLDTVNEVMERYNKYAEHESAPLGTQSSISKDMKFIFDGHFVLNILNYNKELKSTFRPSSMLNSDEICQINKLILGLTNTYDIRSKINNYVSENAYSHYKTKAVYAFVDEQSK